MLSLGDVPIRTRHHIAVYELEKERASCASSHADQTRSAGAKIARGGNGGRQGEPVVGRSEANGNDTHQTTAEKRLGRVPRMRR